LKEITVAKTAGYCFGVRRAVDLALGASKNREVYTTGPLIHNRHAISKLAQAGVRTAESADEIPCGAQAVIRAHGIAPQERERLLSRGCALVDATCPYVAKIHAIAADESEKGRLLLIIGQADHPEVMGIAARAKDFAVVSTEEQVKEASEKYRETPLSVVCQTTFDIGKYNQFVKILKNTCNFIAIFDTICKATELRQNEARSRAGKSDVTIVIGDRLSSNSNNLYRICKQYCPKTVFVEDADQLDCSLGNGAQTIFITAGASTPDFIIKEVVRTMADEQNMEANQSFEEMVEQSFKTLHTGEKVSGIVTQINNNDIHVDLGVKQAGYIPMSELSDDPNFNVQENVKIGDEIEAYVIRVNDVEGLIQLSKKRLDAVKNWEKLEQAVESKESLDGVVVEQNKGGVVASVMGIRVFVPASQTGLPRGASFDEMLKNHYKVRITEVNRHRRRVVGSIKALLSETRKEAAAKVWDTIEIGAKYSGVVKSFTNYGAFVDIGGVDGMVHISELSWNRIKHPSEVLSIGQEVEVYVIALDHDKKKISLGYRKAEDNPWSRFEASFKEGDTATVKIVKFMPFGAFAEVAPGVDGLIHISQIANRRIGKPEEALKLGQEVEAKITHIDNEKKKISLSIRALTDFTSAADELPPEEEK